MSKVFVDTNVLFPFSVMDLMLALTEDGVHEVLWTQASLAEWERVIVRAQRRSAASAAAITAAVREHFADSEPSPSTERLDKPGDSDASRRNVSGGSAGRQPMVAGTAATACGTVAGHGQQGRRGLHLFQLWPVRGGRDGAFERSG
jgi:hypothetical protein